MDISFLELAVTGVVVLWVCMSYAHRRRSKGLPYPPGPRGLPVIGNMLNMPTSHEWLKAAEWQKTFGDIIFLEVLGNPVVFLNSFETAVDLLEKRSALYSSRPSFIMMNELQKWDWFTASMPYGDRWRKHRSFLHRFLEPSDVAKYTDRQTQDAHKLLSNLLNNPNAFFDQVRNCVGSSTMNIAYGIETKKDNDPYIELADKALTVLAEASAPGRFLVEVIPWLKYVPAWLPGAGFQQVAKEGYELSTAMKDVPYKVMKGKILDGNAPSSILSELIEANMGENGSVNDEEVIASVAGIVYGAGADTTVSTLLTFMLAMTLYPEAQKHAQEELDLVVGADSLPNLDDRANLPFIEALCKECLRWQPVAPLATPHALTQDDIYNGYFFPKGTTFLANQWVMLRDPEEYPDPEAFKPERFLPVDESGGSKKVPRDPAKSAFGFGRR